MSKSLTSAAQSSPTSRVQVSRAAACCAYNLAAGRPHCPNKGSRMLLNWSGGNASNWSGRALEPEWLECAGPALADRNLCELARINRWFGGHRALLRMMKDLVRPLEHFSVLDVGAGSGDMGRCLTHHFPKATVVSLDNRPLHLRNATSPRVVADAFQLPFAKHAFDFVLCSSVLHHFPDYEVVDMISTLRQFARRALLL